VGKRQRRHRRSVVLRATTLPVSSGVIVAFDRAGVLQPAN
jgi:hypothetical protein